MTSLQAGFGKLDITSRAVGRGLVGYGPRAGPSLGVHDPLFARALVLGSPAEPVAICSVDLCYVGEDVVRAARERIAGEVGISPERVFISATHTHSGPHDLDPDCWPDGVDACICGAVARAHDRLRPARAGAGFGMVHGQAMNRRRFEDAVDPALLVVRVDDATSGRPLGVYYGFGCHPVVLGPDNRLVSGDWPASSSHRVESRLGPGAVAVFGQGACADVNPLTAAVRERLGEGRAVSATSEATAYYGPPDAADPERRIGNRAGGTFAEAERIGGAVAEEVLRVGRGIRGRESCRAWTRTLRVDGPAGGRAEERPAVGAAWPRAAAGRPLEIMLVGIDGPGVLLLGQPGEVFAGTGGGLRRDLRRLGFAHPFVVGCANGWRGYLPPAGAFPDGGYEVRWARAMGLREGLQDDVRALVLDTLDRSRPSRPRGPKSRW